MPSALLSKSIVMTLPLILLLLDVYPLGRLPLPLGHVAGGGDPDALEGEAARISRSASPGPSTSYWAVAVAATS